MLYVLKMRPPGDDYWVQCPVEILILELGVGHHYTGHVVTAAMSLLPLLYYRHRG